MKSFGVPVALILLSMKIFRMLVISYKGIKMEPPRVVPKKVKEWTTDQPEAEVLPTLPFRVALLGPSGSGKTQLIQSMLCEFYRRRGRSVFARI